MYGERQSRFLPCLSLATVLCVLTLLPQPAICEQCTQQGSCQCTSSAGTINLSPVQQFTDVPDQTGSWLFSYSPCQPFSEGSMECQSVSVCQVSNSHDASYPCGTVDSAVWGQDIQGQTTVTYSKTDSGTQTKRTTVVTLVCSKDGADSLVVQGEDPIRTATYTMTLTSRHCCPGNDPGPSPTRSASLSGGTIFIIVCVSLASVYLLVGIGVQKGLRKASGKELIPNYTFWASIPALVKDGTLLTVRGCKASRTYDKI